MKMVILAHIMLNINEKFNDHNLKNGNDAFVMWGNL
jgi:hypothetical protein